MTRFLTTDRPCKTTIDSLILFEQLINIVNGPVILMKLLKIFNPEGLEKWQYKPLSKINFGNVSGPEGLSKREMAVQSVVLKISQSSCLAKLQCKQLSKINFGNLSEPEGLMSTLSCCIANVMLDSHD